MSLNGLGIKLSKGMLRNFQHSAVRQEVTEAFKASLLQEHREFASLRAQLAELRTAIPAQPLESLVETPAPGALAQLGQSVQRGLQEIVSFFRPTPAAEARLTTHPAPAARSAAVAEPVAPAAAPVAPAVRPEAVAEPVAPAAAPVAPAIRPEAVAEPVAPAAASVEPAVRPEAVAEPVARPAAAAAPAPAAAPAAAPAPVAPAVRPEAFAEPVAPAAAPVAPVAVPLAERLQAIEAQLTAMEQRLPYLTGIKIKRAFSFEPQGHEYAQVRSPLVMGVKHPTVKATLPLRGQVPVPAYVQRVQHFAVDFNRTLKEGRSPFISPRLAVNQPGLSPEEALDGYKRMYQAHQVPLQFEHPAVNPGLPRHELATGLAQASVPTKVLQNGKFRIQVQHNPALGPVTAKISQPAGVNSAQLVDNGLHTAVRLHQALAPNPALAPHLSPKILRTNAFTKRVNLKELNTFEQAAATFSRDEVQGRIRALQEQGVEVKVLRDMTFRIIRRNAKGEIAKEYRLPIRKGQGMSQFIEESLTEAERKARKELPEKVSFFRRLKNEFRPLKKTFTDL